jgi:hypothetical protein
MHNLIVGQMINFNELNKFDRHGIRRNPAQRCNNHNFMFFATQIGIEALIFVNEYLFLLEIR